LETVPYIHSSFILAACDSLYPDEHYQQLVKTHQWGLTPATLTLMEVPPEEIARASSVEMVNGRVVRVVEKPSPADAPSHIASLALYAFDRRILDYLERVQPSSRGELELQEAIQLMIADAGGLAGLTTAWRWELTTPEDLLMMNLNVLAMTPRLHVAPPGLTVRPPVFVERGVSLPSNVRLGPNVYLEAGARIGPGAHLRNCVVLRDGLVPPRLAVEGMLISSE
jgi:dTDP-glucose pyrophosphorylase